MVEIGAAAASYRYRSGKLLLSRGEDPEYKVRTLFQATKPSS